MKVLLINPPTLYTSRSGGGIDIPFGLLAIAALVKFFADVSILDISAEQFSKVEVVEKIKQIQPDVVGITCWISTFPYVKWLSQAIADLMPNVPIIGGGPFATVAPEIYLNHTKISVVVIGEGEITFPHLLHAIENREQIGVVPGVAYKRDGKVTYSPIRKELFRLDEIVRYPYEFIPMDKYLGVPFERFSARGTSLLTDRGCPCFPCSFCNANYLGRYRARSFDNVREEVKFLREKYNVDLLFICDAILTLSREKTEKISELMADLGMEWFGQTRVDRVLRYSDLLPVMAERNCKELWLGFENANQSIAKKGVTIGQCEGAIDLIQNAGMGVVLFVLFGLPGDTEESLQATIDFVKRKNVLANPSALFVIPGTSLATYTNAMGKGLDFLDLTQRFYDEYFQSNRNIALPNLSNVSDMRIKEAIDELWEHNRSLKV